MENTHFYIPVNSGTLAHYLGRALILPAKYFANKPADLQDQLKDYILLSRNQWTGESDCSVEVILTAAEQATLIPVKADDRHFAFGGGIPVSRIAAVHFRDAKQAETIQWNINSGTAYLPDQLIRVATEPASSADAGPFALTGSALPPDLSEKAKRFDILLGGLAFLKAAARNGAEFPRHYFAVLGHFNGLVREQLAEAARQGMYATDDFLVSLFVNKPSQWSAVQSLFFEEVQLATVESAAKKANVKIAKKYGLIELDQLDPSSNIYLLALLATYGNQKPKHIQDLIAKISDERKLDDDSAEVIALVFGLNMRYSGLRNSYNDRQTTIKFRLEGLLDAYAIESIFQYTFISQKDIRSFPYLDALFPQSSPATAGFGIMTAQTGLKKKPSAEAEFLAQLGGSFPEVQKAFEAGAIKALQPLIRLLEEKDRTIDQLERTLRQNEEELKALRQAPASPKSKPEAPKDADGLEQMDFTKLKALAKAKKLNAKTYGHLKATQQGFSELIRLIRAQQTLL